MPRLVGALGACTALTLWAHAEVSASAQPLDSVKVATSGNGSELVRTIPIVRDRASGKHVVMSLSPRKLPRLDGGDRLRLSAELETTNDCLDPGPQCIGQPYGYSPRVNSRLLLARSATATGGPNTLALSERESLTCRQPLPHREHHCVTVFSRETFDVPQAGLLPCAPNRCRVNLVTWARHRRADPGDLLLIGINTPSGAITQDKGRINVARERPGSIATPRHDSTSARVRRTMDVERGARRTIYSLRLPNLREREQFTATARMVSDIAHLPYSTFIGAQLVITTGRTATRPTALVERTISLNGDVTEGTGFNCTQVTTPCTSRKAGVFRVRRDAPRRDGRPIPFFLNLVSRNAPKRVDDRPGDAIRIVSGGGIRVVRYPPQLAP
jgi:hypothetical protein